MSTVPKNRQPKRETWVARLLGLAFWLPLCSWVLALSWSVGLASGLLLGAPVSVELGRQLETGLSRWAPKQKLFFGRSFLLCGRRTVSLPECFGTLEGALPHLQHSLTFFLRCPRDVQRFCLVIKAILEVTRYFRVEAFLRPRVVSVPLRNPQSA